MSVVILVPLTIIVVILLVVVIFIGLPVTVPIIPVTLLTILPWWGLSISPFRAVVMVAALLAVRHAWWGYSWWKCVWLGWVLVLVVVRVGLSMGWKVWRG